MASTTNKTGRQVYNLAGIPQPAGYKSMAVRAGGLIFVSGQIGKGPDGLPLPTVEEQAAGAFRQIAAILELAGSSLANVVKLSILVTEAEYQFRLQDVKREFFPTDPPATMGAVVKGLALGAKVEIDAIATVDG
ncbi:MAG: RidA family protein [Lautropia sp.]